MAMVALFLLIGCNGAERQRQEEADAAYAAGCQVGQVAGAVTGGADGKACRKRSLVPMDDAEKGMEEYCGSDVYDTGQPCSDWKSGYVACWLAGYDLTYPVKWDEADCGPPASGK
jgi:hypothetical protein